MRSDEVQSLRDEGFGDDKDERGRGGIIERTHKLIFSVQLWRLHYGVEVLQGEGLRFVEINVDVFNEWKRELRESVTS